MLTIHLPAELEHRLTKLTQNTRYTVDSIVTSALEEYLDEWKSALIAVAEYEKNIRDGTLKTYTMEEVIERCGFDKS